MAVIRPFCAVRPAEALAAEVAALPYDVYTREEAAAYAAAHPKSFLNIDRPETAFPPDADMYAPCMYEHARKTYLEWKSEGIFVTEAVPCYYVYELTMDGRTQTGIAALSSVDDYLNGICKKHENTVAQKEKDRICHVDALSAQTGPIFLSYEGSSVIEEITARAKTMPPLYDVCAEDGIRHRIFRIAEPEVCAALTEAFGAVPCTYIADGHHRAASAVKVALKRRAENPAHTGEEEYNFFLSVLFPAKELRIYDYNRVVSDLNGLTPAAFLEALSESFAVEQIQAVPDQNGLPDAAWRPAEKFTFGMYLDQTYYGLTLQAEMQEARRSDPVAALDVAVLQDLVLSPLLGIGDPRTDSRIRFLGGIRGLHALKEAADRCTKAGTGKGPAVAFSMYPTSMEELFRVADAGRLMPPKSTWFEPKLRSGFLIHEF